MRGKKNSLVLSMVVFGTFLLMASFVSSFAVGSKYSEDKILVVNPGETVDFFVVLQNIAGEGGDVNVEGTITEGGEIASFQKSPATYYVPFGKKLNVNLTASIPEDAALEEITEIVISFKIIAGEGSDALGLGSSIERVIPVNVVEAAPVESEGEGVSVLMWLLIVVVVALVIWFYKKRSN